MARSNDRSPTARRKWRAKDASRSARRRTPRRSSIRAIPGGAMARVIRNGVSTALFVLIGCTVAFAQATAQLSGTVRDESGGVLPGVSVTATQTDTGLSRAVVTEANGSYVITSLPTGPYRLEAALQGFRTYVQTGIVLQVGASPVINAVLGVGALEQAVTVQGAAPLVDVQSAGVREVVENERIVELPLQGRQVTDLIVLAGAAVNTADVSGQRQRSDAVAISVAGGLRAGVTYVLDGAMHNDPYDNLNLPFPFPDAMQEFSVATSGLSADNGMHSAAAVNAVTKSGTNKFSGNAFEFLRDHRFNSPAYFAPMGPDGKRVDDGLRRNQFGGTIGGPIIRNKLFFFAGHQSTVTHQIPAAFNAITPTAAMLAGDFTTFASPACNVGRQITLRAPFVNNRIDPASFSKAALAVAQKLPPSADPCGQIRYSVPLDNNDYQDVGRVDYQLSANHTIFGRYITNWEHRLQTYSRTGNVLTINRDYGANKRARAHSLALGDTRVFGSQMVNTLRVTFNKTSNRLRRQRRQVFAGEQVVSGRQRSVRRTRQAPDVVRREPVVLEVSDDRQRALRGPVQFQRRQHRSGTRRLPDGTVHGIPGQRARRAGHETVVPGCVRAGHVENHGPADAERGSALGAVLRPEHQQRRHCQFLARQSPAGHQDDEVRQRATRAHLSGRSGIPFRQLGNEHPMAQLLAAGRSRMGRQRQRPDRGAIVLRHQLRLPDGTVSLCRGLGVALLEPPRHHGQHSVRGSVQERAGRKHAAASGGASP
ncbi:MAG: hypothetical protein DMF87_08335 [Acidobacteria bacterium]|nr:MAG: hypothetical protein DMF87_08335 [Acidobacteriota bacterium]